MWKYVNKKYDAIPEMSVANVSSTYLNIQDPANLKIPLNYFLHLGENV